MCEPSCPATDQTHTPCTGKQNPNHWTAREVPTYHLKQFVVQGGGGGGVQRWTVILSPP